MKLKGDFEVFAGGVKGNIFDSGICNVSSECLFDFPDAIVNIGGRALSEHFDSAVREVSDQAGQLMTVGKAQCGEAETDTLNAACKDYMSGREVHLDIYINRSRSLTQEWPAE